MYIDDLIPTERVNRTSHAVNTTNLVTMLNMIISRVSKWCITEDEIVFKEVQDED